MTPTTSHIQLRSFNCSGCDCGACANDVVTAVQGVEGVVHARLDRRRTGIVVRYDPELVDEATLRSRVGDSKLTIR